MPTQLRLQDIRVLKIEYSLNPIAADTSALEELSQLPLQQQKIEIKMNFRSEYITMENNQPILKASQGVHVTGSSIPFTIYVEIGGLFSFDPQPPPDELDRLRHINCNAILFPYARELVGDICRRGGLPPVYLQPVNFVKLYEDGIFKSAPLQ
jgi:preprotein translocase subunit SecB